MAVHAKRDRNRRMTEAFLDHAQVDALLECRLVNEES